MKKTMDKRMQVYRKKKILYCGTLLVLTIFAIILVWTGISNRKRYEQSQIESTLPSKEQAEDNSIIRVLIKTNGFAQIAHSSVEIKATSGIVAVSGGKQRECDGGNSMVFTPNDPFFQNGIIKVSCKSEEERINITSLQRGYGSPSYRGELELFSTAEGIVIVNELPMEEYLCAVVPSEMPASYELEALKAQAVCARSYAYNQTRDYAYPEYCAHVDDSISFQVYGNSQEQENTNRAVEQTTGEKIWYNNQVATAYYYSTSSGKTASIEAWGSALNATNQYLQSRDVCNEKGESYEAGLPWYRWTATVSEQIMSDLIEMNTQTEIGTLLNIAITKEGAGGIVQEITAVGTTGKVIVETENKIRRAMGGSGYQIVKRDGTVVNSSKLLPSAFFSIEKRDGNYIVHGGGYGHGIGMSQNGANEMAKKGKNYREILSFFYTGVEVR